MKKTKETISTSQQGGQQFLVQEVLPPTIQKNFGSEAEKKLICSSENSPNGSLLNPENLSRAGTLLALDNQADSLAH
ncbi:MAG: hypothetical protein R3F37_14735 [Candidatus Competibacteraceae bacterium]